MRTRGRGQTGSAKLLAVLLALAACRGITPLTNRISPGTEPFLVLVGEDTGGQSDLFAGSAGGGEVVRLTFTREVEWAPALDPSGGVVAFLRQPPVAARGAVALVLMNLVNGAERAATVPASLGPAIRVGWSRDGGSVFVQGEHGVAVTAAPPAPLALEALAPGDSRMAAADSALTILLGDPPAARVERCPGDPAEQEHYCVVTAAGERQPLAGELRDPFRWGADSLGYFEGDRLMARPLAGGRARRVAWAGLPSKPRQPTYHGGVSPEEP